MEKSHFSFPFNFSLFFQGGVYIFQLIDFYAVSGISLLWCTFFQTIAICWIFGAKKMYNCIELMVGYKIPIYWLICWVFVAPAFMGFLFLFYFIKYTPIMYGKDYAYPQWGEMLGFMISLSSMVSLKFQILLNCCKTFGPGSIWPRLCGP